MNVRNRTAVGWALGSALLLPACSPSAPQGSESADQQAAPSAITNRLDVPPEVVSNLGITFEVAERGRLGLWREVPGELVVPVGGRWEIRSPARARVLSVASLWQAMARGAAVATLAAPDVACLQGELALAERAAQIATAEARAARARRDESEVLVEATAALERFSRARLEALQGQQASSLTAIELVEAQRGLAQASQARLDAAVVRDDLGSRAAAKELEADRARLAIAEKLSALALVTGRPVAELAEPGEAGPAWRQIRDLSVPAPAAAIVVQLFTAPGEVVEAGAPIAHLSDTSELHFHGHVPEGDHGWFAAGQRVRIELPSSQLAPIEARLAAPIPVADPKTRMVRVAAHVPNPQGTLADGLSAMAHVLVQESASEEVLIPARCVIFDGLEAIVFKRDAGDPNVVIRQPVEIGARAADRVEALAGVIEGDALVADGIYQLKQTGLGKAPEGGHFHADGTWHADHK
ncbi:MAG: efflux RND transporter periplasmic adaptor subunit [Planctomycetota bacterium]